MLNILIIAAESEPLASEIAARLNGEDYELRRINSSDDPDLVRSEVEASHVVAVLRPQGPREFWAIGLAAGLTKKVIVLDAGGPGSNVPLERGVARATSIDDVVNEVHAVVHPSLFIDGSWFRRQGACEAGAAWFERRYPEGGFTRQWTREEQIRALADGGGRWIRLGKKRRIVTLYDMEGVDLRGAQLRGADLRGLSFEKAIFEGADLSRGDYRGVRFRGAKLSGANLQDAGLRQCDLRDADLRGASLGRARLVGAKLAGANLENADLSGADLTEANLSGLDLRNTLLRGALLARANFTGANLAGCDISGTNATGAIFFGARLEGSRLDGTNFSGADLRDISVDETTSVTGAWFAAAAGVPLSLDRRAG